MEDIGEDTAALLCVTNRQGCCSGVGQFFYPNGSAVPVNSVGHSLYRNRGDQLIRLNRISGDIAPSGVYTCMIQDADGMNRNLSINIGVGLLKYDLPHDPSMINQHTMCTLTCYTHTAFDSIMQYSSYECKSLRVIITFPYSFACSSVK